MQPIVTKLLKLALVGQQLRERIENLEREVQAHKGKSQPESPQPRRISQSLSPMDTQPTVGNTPSPDRLHVPGDTAEQLSQRFEDLTVAGNEFPFRNWIISRLSRRQSAESPVSPRDTEIESAYPVSEIASKDPSSIVLYPTTGKTAITRTLAVIGVVSMEENTSPFVQISSEIVGGPRSTEAVTRRIAKVSERAPCFAPIALQSVIQHHPCIDIIPFRSFREAIFRSIAASPESIDQEELCHDLVNGGLCIWGKVVHDARSFELSQEFVSDWGWLLDEESLSTTNFWRAQRGEEALRSE